MLSPTEFRDLVSGRRRGIGASALRLVLRVAAGFYSLAMRLRNWRYDTASAKISHAEVPVVSVGNLTLGGTGKTPMVEWIARWYRQHAVRVTLISRGYGAQSGARNDEALELELRLPDVPHLQNPDRVAAAAVAFEEFQCQLILLDDAFQHRRLARDLDIVLLDALEPFGYGYVFPRGTLREPLVGLRRAHVVALSRADMLPTSQREAIRAKILSYAPHAEWIETTHAPRRLVAASGAEQPLAALRGQRVAAFCGIGNPAGFRHTLSRCELEVVELREFADHYAYQRDDVQSLVQWADALTHDRQIAAVVCTSKDLVKLGVDRLGDIALWAVEIGLEITAGKDALEARLARVLGKSSNHD